MIGQKSVSIIVPVFNTGKYVISALNSALDQDLDSMEIIVVNDGSTDDSEGILKEYAKLHPEVIVISQEQQGVSAARNTALNRASGRYVAFLDSDDLFERNAVSDMYHLAELLSADLVVGAFKVVGFASSQIAVHSRKLAEKNELDPFDVEFVYNFGVWNKLFRRSLIEDRHLRFEPLRHAEDGVFLFEYLNYHPHVVGCPRVVYRYMKYLPMERVATVGNVSSILFRDLIVACSKIEKLIEDWPEDVIRKLYGRILRTSIIEEYYRNLWRMDCELLQNVIDKATEYRNRISNEEWTRIVSDMPDLPLDGGFWKHEDFLEHPLITVAVYMDLTDVELSDFLQMLYNQNSPSFELVLDERYLGHLPDNLKEMQNIRFEKLHCLQDIFRISRGKYVQIITEKCGYEKDTLKFMVKRLRNSNRDFLVTLPCVYDDNLQVYESDFLNAQFTAQNKEELKKNDCFLSNKLFCKEKISSIITSDMGLKQVVSMAYENLSAEIVKNPRMLMGLNAIGTNPVLPESTVRNVVESKTEKPIQKAGTSKGKTTSRIQKLKYWFTQIIYPMQDKRRLYLFGMLKKHKYSYEYLLRNATEKQESCSLNFGEKGIPAKKKMAALSRAQEIIVYHKRDEYPYFSRRKEQRLLYEILPEKLIYKSREVGYIDSWRDQNLQLLVASKWMKGRAEELFGKRKYIYGPLPHYQVYRDEVARYAAREEVSTRYWHLKEKKLLLIAPEFRKRRFAQVLEELHPQRLHDELGDEYLLLYWFDASSRKKIDGMGLDWTKYSNYARIVEKNDLEMAILAADQYVTDYSWTMFRMSLTGRNIVQYWPDRNLMILKKLMPGTVLDYACGNVVLNREQMVKEILKNKVNRTVREGFLLKYLKYCVDKPNL